MARQKRAEKQAETRELLLATAEIMFLRDGYHPTSLEKVADEAGFSKGAVYSNFRSKDELCIAVLKRVRGQRFSALQQALRSAPTPEARVLTLAKWADLNIGDGEWHPLEMEFAAHARRDPELRKILAKHNALLLDIGAELITVQSAELGRKPALPVMTISSALAAMGIGLGFFRSLDPRISTSGMADVFRFFLDPAGPAPKTVPKAAKTAPRK